MPSLKFPSAGIVCLAAALTLSTAHAGTPSPSEVVARAERLCQPSKETGGIHTEAAVAGATRGVPLCGDLSIYAELRATVSQMTREQQDRVAALNPGFGAYVADARVRSGELRTKAVTGINVGKFENSKTGRHVVVHYTYDPLNAPVKPAGYRMSDQAYADYYAELVKTDFDYVVEVYDTKPFGRPYFAGPEYHAGANPSGRCHVYIHSLQGEPGAKRRIMANTVPVPTGYEGNPICAAYFNVFNNLPSFDQAGTDNWRARLIGTLMHEYMHGIQVRHAFGSNQEWFREGQAVWAETKYGPTYVATGQKGDWGSSAPDDHLSGFLRTSDSVVNQPDLPLWYFRSPAGGDPGSTHQYSVGAFMLWASFLAGNGSGDASVEDYFMNAWLQEMEGTDDALVGLLRALADSGSNYAFPDVYLIYLSRLYAREIPYVTKSKVPRIAAQPLGLPGASIAADLPPTGAAYYEVTPDPAVNASCLFASLNADSSPTAGTSLSAPTSQDHTVYPGIVGKAAFFENFPQAKSVLLILSDPNSQATDLAATTQFRGSLIAPLLTSYGIDPIGTVKSGDSADFNMNYDLVGMAPGDQDLPIDVRVSSGTSHTYTTDPDETAEVGTGIVDQGTIDTRGVGNTTVQFDVIFQYPAASFVNGTLSNWPTADFQGTFTVTP